MAVSPVVSVCRARDRGNPDTPPPSPLPEAERGRKTDQCARVGSNHLLPSSPPLRFGEGVGGRGVFCLSPPLRFGEGALKRGFQVTSMPPERSFQRLTAGIPPRIRSACRRQSRAAGAVSEIPCGRG